MKNVSRAAAGAALAVATAASLMATAGSAAADVGPYPATVYCYQKPGSEGTKYDNATRIKYFGSLSPIGAVDGYINLTPTLQRVSPAGGYAAFQSLPYIPQVNLPTSTTTSDDTCRAFGQVLAQADGNNTWSTYVYGTFGERIKRP